MRVVLIDGNAAVAALPTDREVEYDDITVNFLVANAQLCFAVAGGR